MKKKEVIAYKAFFEGLVNGIDGISYEVGKEYATSDELQYMKGGFHMCEKPEDCFRFLKPEITKVELTLVKGYGKMYGFDAGYRAYDDTLGYIYICEKMRILKVFSREEIIEMALKMDTTRLEIFLGLYPLTEEEKELFKKAFRNQSSIFGHESIPKLIDRTQKKFIKRKDDNHG